MGWNVTFSEPAETKIAVDFSVPAAIIEMESSQPAGKMAVKFSETTEKISVLLVGSPCAKKDYPRDYPWDYTPPVVNQSVEFGEIQIVNTKVPNIGYITLLANAWVGTGNIYSQIVSVDGATKHSQVNLTPSIEQLAAFYEKDIAFVTENEDGVITVYAIGQKPTNDYTMQVTLTEVSV